jgi:hypothetical protein
MFAVIQEDVAIFGSGLTPEEAWEDAKEWMDKDEEDEPMSLVECTESLYQEIQRNGGGTVFVVHNNLAQTWAEFEEVSDDICC